MKKLFNILCSFGLTCLLGVGLASCDWFGGGETSSETSKPLINVNITPHLYEYDSSTFSSSEEEIDNLTMAVGKDYKLTFDIEFDSEAKDAVLETYGNFDLDVVVTLGDYESENNWAIYTASRNVGGTKVTGTNNGIFRALDLTVTSSFRLDFVRTYFVLGVLAMPTETLAPISLEFSSDVVDFAYNSSSDGYTIELGIIKGSYTFTRANNLTLKSASSATHDPDDPEYDYYWAILTIPDPVDEVNVSLNDASGRQLATGTIDRGDSSGNTVEFNFGYLATNLGYTTFKTELDDAIFLGQTIELYWTFSTAETNNYFGGEFSLRYVYEEYSGNAYDA